MAKRTFQLTENEIKDFKLHEQQTKRVDELRRLQAVRLYGSGYNMNSITEMLGCAEHSVRLWVLDYTRNGIDRLLSQYGNSAQNARRLSLEQEQDLTQKLREYRPQQVLERETYPGTGEFWTVVSVQVVVEKWYGVRYGSLVSYRNRLHRCGFSYQKSEGVYKSRPSEQVINDFEAAFEKK
jgi:transposase